MTDNHEPTSLYDLLDDERRNGAHGTSPSTAQLDVDEPVTLEQVRRRSMLTDPSQASAPGEAHGGTYGPLTGPSRYEPGRHTRLDADPAGGIGTADGVAADAVGVDAVGVDAVGVDAVGVDAVGVDAVGVDPVPLLGEASGEGQWDAADGFVGGNSLRARMVERRREAKQMGEQREQFRRRLLFNGPPGPHAGAVVKKFKTRPVVETTRQLAGTYPFVTDNGMPLFGQFVGRDIHSRAAFGWDSIEAYRREIVTSPVISVSGVVGSSKSSLAKTMVLRGVPFGRKFAVPGDIRGEYGSMCRALGVEPLILGPGSPARYNPLAAPKRPARVPEQLWAETVAQHRYSTLEALAMAVLQRKLTGTELNALRLALAAAVRQDGSVDRWAQPTLGDISRWLNNPVAEDIQHSGIRDTDRFIHECYDLGLYFLHLINGVFAGVFDANETRTLDMSGVCTVVDMSRLQLNDAALALIVTCNQAAIELNCQFDPTPWYVVYDEMWRYMRFLGLLARLAHRVKVVRRMDGGIPLLVSHRISDFITGDPELDAIATGMLSDIDTHVIYRQAVAEVAATQRHLNLRSSEAALLPQLAQGQALWHIGKNQRSMIIQHEVVRDGHEWPLIDTDQPIVNGYRDLVDPAGQMAGLMNDAA